MFSNHKYKSKKKEMDLYACLTISRKKKRIKIITQRKISMKCTIG